MQKVRPREVKTCQGHSQEVEGGRDSGKRAAGAQEVDTTHLAELTCAWDGEEDPGGEGRGMGRGLMEGKEERKEVRLHPPPPALRRGLCHP